MSARGRCPFPFGRAPVRPTRVSRGYDWHGIRWDLGAKAIHQAGAEVVIQDQATSVVWGMPGSVASALLADHIYALGAIAPEIIRRVMTRRPVSSAAAKLQRQLSVPRSTTHP